MAVFRKVLAWPQLSGLTVVAPHGLSMAEPCAGLPCVARPDGETPDEAAEMPEAPKGSYESQTADTHKNGNALPWRGFRGGRGPDAAGFRAGDGVTAARFASPEGWLMPGRRLFRVGQAWACDADVLL